MYSQWGMCAASHFCLRWVWPAGQSSCSPMLLVCFHAHVQLFQIFTPWGQCWNCVHLSSLHTRQELTLAFICAAGQWASLTETFRPLRWLLSFLSLYHSLRLLFLCQLQPDLPFSPYFNLHFCLGSPSFFSSFVCPSPLLLHTALWFETDCTVRRRQQSWWSANLLSFLQSTSVCVHVHMTDSVESKTRQSSAFRSQRVTQKPQERSSQ